MRKWIRADVIVLFLLAAAVGAVVKMEVSKRFTIGFDDYRIENRKQQYDFKKLAAEAAEKQEQQKGQQPDMGGGSCGQ
jgi:hypothetical protein